MLNTCIYIGTECATGRVCLSGSCSLESADLVTSSRPRPTPVTVRPTTRPREGRPVFSSNTLGLCDFFKAFGIFLSQCVQQLPLVSFYPSVTNSCLWYLSIRVGNSLIRFLSESLVFWEKRANNERMSDALKKRGIRSFAHFW